MLPLFTILESSTPMNQPACLKKDDFNLSKKLSHTKRLDL